MKDGAGKQDERQRGLVGESGSRNFFVRKNICDQVQHKNNKKNPLGFFAYVFCSRGEDLKDENIVEKVIL